MSMSFNNILLLSALLLTACATSEGPVDSVSQQDGDKTINTTSESDVQKYSEAVTLLGSGQLDKAHEALTDFTEDHPHLAGPWANLALIAIKRNKMGEAEKLLNKALERNPNLAQAYNLMAFIEKNRGNIVKARDLYIKAIELKENYALAHYNLALIYDIYMQDIPKAVAHYQKYMALNKTPDKNTAEWVEQLKASLKKG